MEGGGWCNTEEECIARANTTLGSSKDWPKARGCSCKNIQTNGDGNVLDKIVIVFTCLIVMVLVSVVIEKNHGKKTLLVPVRVLVATLF